MTPLRFALIGNPNCGKTSLFNRLTGARAKVANYAGVTVERRTGPLQAHPVSAELIDLPGTYSLQVTSPDEQVARDVVLGNMPGEAVPDLLIAVVDATNLRLGLRLVLELKALNVPLIIAVNQADAARRRGIDIDIGGLSRSLGLPVVETVAVNKRGTRSLEELLRNYQSRNTLPLPAADSPAAVSVEQTYQQISNLLAEHVIEPHPSITWQDRIDMIVMHPVYGMMLLMLVLLATFQAVFAWAAPIAELIEGGVQALADTSGNVLPNGILKEFLVNGVIAGTGSVLVFLPQIIILFLFILILEDSGYLPRAAFLLDRPMRGVGLSGRSFIPLLSSFACAVPGIMATRTVQDPRERFITIMIAPLMTCSARLPVYTLIISAFIPHQTVAGIFNLQGLTLFALYVMGIISAAIIAWIIRKGQAAAAYPLLMELPDYRWPVPWHVLVGLRERASIFLRRVGTIILALSIVVWFLSSYPQAPLDASRPAIEYSFAGIIGQFIQPLFAPLGFTWQMCIALIPAMAAREVAVSVLATVYATGGMALESALGQSLSAHWTLPAALAWLAWFVYAPQCISTIAVVHRETNSAKATLGFTAYLFLLAWLAAWLVYQLALAWI